jgi:hypothetical protein
MCSVSFFSLLTFDSLSLVSSGTLDKERELSYFNKTMAEVPGVTAQPTPICLPCLGQQGRYSLELSSPGRQRDALRLAHLFIDGMSSE